MRNQVTQLLVAAMGSSTAALGASVWNPYQLPGGAFAGERGRPCAALGIATGRPQGQMCVVGVTLATAADVTWALRRRAPTLLVRGGRLCAGESRGECLAAFGPGGYSPELYRAAVEGANRAPEACRLYEAVRFIAFGIKKNFLYT